MPAVYVADPTMVARSRTRPVVHTEDEVFALPDTTLGCFAALELLHLRAEGSVSEEMEVEESGPKTLFEASRAFARH